MLVPTLPISDLPQFISLQPVTLTSIAAVHIGGSPIDVGTALVCTSDIPARTVFAADESFVLCTESIEIGSKSDRHLLDLLKNVFDGGFLKKKPRLLIMVFLILRMSTAAGLGVGVGDVWSEYVKFLPKEVMIPTMWSGEERMLLIWTSLEQATNASLSKLSTEFDSFKTATAALPWAQKVWWGSGELTLKDWTLADAWFRSRVLKLPTKGLTMVPILDFANHRTGDAANAAFGYDFGMNYTTLKLCADVKVAEGDEITIDYSSGTKGAAEMVFSYGFVEDDRTDAGVMVLGVGAEWIHYDPLAAAKKAVWGKAAPALELKREADGKGLVWRCDFLWLVIVNEEDGLSFKVLQEIDGTRSLCVFWNDEEIKELWNIRELLEKTDMWPVYQLRAVCLLIDQLAEQVQGLVSTEESCEMLREIGSIADQPWAVSLRLRKLEREFMKDALKFLEKEKSELIENEKVEEFLSKMQDLDIEDEGELDLS